MRIMLSVIAGNGAPAITLGVSALSQFRFMFGCGFPLGLAPKLPHAKNGSSAAAEHLQHQMREGAVLFKEPPRVAYEHPSLE